MTSEKVFIPLGPLADLVSHLSSLSWGVEMIRRGMRCPGYDEGSCKGV